MASEITEQYDSSQTAKIQSLRNRVRESISSLIFAEELCSELQEHVESQCQLGFLDRDVNRYLLKLYQMYPKEAENNVRLDMITKILTLSLHNLPKDDFICATALLPNFDRTSDKLIGAVYSAFELLRSCKWEEYWYFIKKGDPEVTAFFSFFAGLDDSIRNYVLTVLGWTYQNIEFSKVQLALGFESANETMALLKKKNLTFVDGRTVEFPLSDANSATLKRKTIKYSADQMNIFLSNMNF